MNALAELLCPKCGSELGAFVVSKGLPCPKCKVFFKTAWGDFEHRGYCQYLMPVEGETASFEVCDCACHRAEGVYHIMPCCSPCPQCGKGIKRVFLKEHRARCKSEGLPKELGHLTEAL